MNRVLIICSNFLPVRNGGTIRCEKMVKYLPDFGWESIVLTRTPTKISKTFYPKDPKYTKIYRTNNFDLANFYVKIKSFISLSENKNKTSKNKTSIKRRFSEYFLVPDSEIFWALGSLLKSFKIVKKEKPLIILSSGPSHSSHLIALFLKITLGVKWVVEFRDPWTMNPFNISKPYKILKIVDDWLEKIVLKKANIINVTSSKYKDQFLEKYEFLNTNKITYIPNGFDPEDFDNILLNKNKKFTIVHSGNFYQHRSSKKIIEALIYMFDNNLLNRENIEVKFIGILDDLGVDIINNSNYRDNFIITGFVSHQESIKEISNSDLLLLIPGPGDGTMPGKFYEYLAASKPIFCIANEGPAKYLIEKYKLGIVSIDHDEIIIANNLNELISNITNKIFKYPNIEKLRIKFDRREIAKQMAEILESELSKI